MKKAYPPLITTYMYLSEVTPLPQCHKTPKVWQPVSWLGIRWYSPVCGQTWYLPTQIVKTEFTSSCCLEWTAFPSLISGQMKLLLFLFLVHNSSCTLTWASLASFFPLFDVLSSPLQCSSSNSLRILCLYCIILPCLPSQTDPLLLTSILSGWGNSKVKPLGLRK